MNAIDKIRNEIYSKALDNEDVIYILNEMDKYFSDYSLSFDAASFFEDAVSTIFIDGALETTSLDILVKATAAFCFYHLAVLHLYKQLTSKHTKIHIQEYDFEAIHLNVADGISNFPKLTFKCTNSRTGKTKEIVICFSCYFFGEYDDNEKVNPTYTTAKADGYIISPRGSSNWYTVSVQELNYMKLFNFLDYNLALIKKGA